jgi:hypothetical protein
MNVVMDQPEAGLRFAFYGRVSTEDYQDPVTSRRWQLEVATSCVAGPDRGRVLRHRLLPRDRLG